MIDFSTKQTVSRVLMTTDTVGGIWDYSLQLAGVLQDYDIEVFLAAMGGPLNDRQARAAGILGNVRVFANPFRMEWMDHPWGDVEAAGKWLLGLEEKVRPDIIHLNNYAHGGLPWETPVVIVGHFDVFSWFQAVDGRDPPRRWNLYYEMVQKGLRGADHVTAPSEYMLRSLKNIYGDFRSGPPVYNGRDPRQYSPREKDSFILSASRLWDQAKNIGFLEKTSSRLDWPVYLAGKNRRPDGPNSRYDNLYSLGPLPPGFLALLMGRASIYAFPAKYEPSGVSILEAALCGCALVLGDTPGLREIWRDNAVYVRPDDEEGFVKMIHLLIYEPKLRQDMQKKARQRALTFNQRQMGKQYAALYSKVIKTARDRPARPGRRAPLFVKPRG